MLSKSFCGVNIPLLPKIKTVSLHTNVSHEYRLNSLKIFYKIELNIIYRGYYDQVGLFSEMKVQYWTTRFTGIHHIDDIREKNKTNKYVDKIINNSKVHSRWAIRKLGMEVSSILQMFFTHYNKYI